MRLFEPIVEESQQHANFRSIMAVCEFITTPTQSI